MKNLKDKVLEIAAIAQECPENLQQICFEILLKNAIAPQQPSSTTQSKTPDEPADSEQTKPQPKNVVEESAKSQDDLTSKDLHVKARRFLEKHDLSVDHLNQLFYKEGDQILALYDDLKTTRTSENQIRIVLLQCLLNAITLGNFQANIEDVRTEASTRKCYDSSNWGNNFKNNAGLFDFTNFTKSVKTVTLSEQGKSELANIIKELQ